ncbi:50S ribosomal protein L23 [uncultured archaeon]|nr:50S ribosomal protein L23 [uncultured archaeon]
MAMMKKKTKAAEKKASKENTKALREKEEGREARKGHSAKSPAAKKAVSAEVRAKSPAGTEGAKVTGRAKITGLPKARPIEARKAEDRAGLAADLSAAAKASESKDSAKGIEIAKDIKGIEAQAADLGILKYLLVTEKAVNMIEAENKLVFVVSQEATKPLIKKAVEDLYKVKVRGVNIIRDMKARKRAIVLIDKKSKASDIATKLGVI